MKKITSLLVVMAVLAMASIGYAGERAGAFSISPFVGGYIYDDDPRDQPGLRENRPFVGLRLGYNLTDYFATELVGNWVRAEIKEDDNEVNHFGVRLDLLYNIMPHSRFVPYLAVGGGAETIDYPGENSEDATFNAGLGFKAFMTDNVAFRADGRHITVFSHKTLSNWEYSVGLSFLFGGRQEAAAATTTPVTEPVREPVAQEPVAQEPVLEPVPAAEPTTPGTYKYCVTLQGEFDVDQAVVRPENYDQIAVVGNFMQKYPTTTAVIEGHSDNVGSPSYNMDLSQRRAESVVNHLVSKFGIDRSRLSAKGYGLTRPIADNSTEAGRQKNRRIEAIIDCAFDVQQVQQPDRLCMSLVLDFDSGKADIKPQYRNEISKVADYMKQYPSTTALIEGHTDNTGSPEANMKLSQKRAENVVNYLVENFGIDRSRLAAKGYGSTMRIAYNNTPEGRQKNRRINAVIDCVINK